MQSEIVREIVRQCDAGMHVFTMVPHTEATRYALSHATRESEERGVKEKVDDLIQKLSNPLTSPKTTEDLRSVIQEFIDRI